MPSPVQSNCDPHDTIANGQYGAVWSLGHTQQVCVRIVLLPSNVWQQFFRRSAFLRQQETDLPPAELWTSTAGSDVVQSGRPIFDDFSNICGRISAITRRMLSSKWSGVCGLSA
ncbi:hypothetical protein TNCV_3888581 [Trichonephila clavipes]|nr:hypothetical protein TNCV_3888581 [Trichonephila clavipes]